MRSSSLFMVVLVSCAGSQKRIQPWSEVRGVAEPGTLRHLVQGDVTGFTEPQGTQAWLGIPYADPPQRWKAPHAAKPWQGVHEAVKYGPLCPQLNGPLAAASQETGDVAGSEDCLTLNVYAPAFTPEQAATERRPVMVWIHGGGNTIGTANVYGFARNLAIEHGVVVINVNYRLGVLGWFHHPALIAANDSAEDVSGNFGTLDLIESLKWVKANAAAFGGDPDNVTVFGESAGGFNVFSLLVSPLAKGLFHRAAIQSGMAVSCTMEQAEHFTDGPAPGAEGSSGEVLLAQLMLDSKIDRAAARAKLTIMSPTEIATYLRGRSLEQLISPFKGAAFGMYRSPALLRDGHVLPKETVVEALASAANVPVLLGTNRDEYKLFMLMNPKYTTRFLGIHIKDEAVYERDARLVADVWRVIGVDLPAAALRKAGTPVFSYRFDWDEEPKYFVANLPKLLGAAHGLEVGFVFDDVASEFDPFGINSKENEPGRVKLARAMASYWVQFARSGAPGRGVDGTLPPWAEMGDESAFMVLDTELSKDKGSQSLEAIEERLAKDPSFESARARCEVQRLLFRDFAGQAGAWTAQRAARYEAQCGPSP